MSSPKKKFGIWASLLIVLSLLLSPVILVVSLVVLLASFTAKDTETKCYSQQTNTFFLPSDASLGKSPKFEEYQSRFDIYPNADEIKAEQREIVKIIIGVAKSRGLGDYDIRLGLATAMQESDLQNLNKGHLDSKGVVQQRPSQGWGTIEQVTDPVYAMNKFYSEAEKITNREQLPLIETAMRVQKPDAAAYRARWEWDPIVEELVANESGPAPIGTIAKQVVIAKDPACKGVETSTMLAVSSAQSKLNQPYDWKDPKGFDGSSLTSWAYKAAETTLPLGAEDQFKIGQSVEKADLQPGDLVFWAEDPADQKTIKEVALWMGSDKVLEAEETGQTIQIVPMKWDGFIGAKRPIPEPQIITAAHDDTSTGKWHSPLKIGSYEKGSPFSMRVNPITGVLELHNGIDLVASGGTPIYSACDGTVTSTEWQDSGGNVTFIKDDEGHTFGYGHQQSRAPNIKVGVKVKAGDLIGYVGTTGGSTGNHLHFMVMTNNGSGVQFAEPVQFMLERGIIL
jgi:murein DD-endopeptidase MepM/ murein hydrolase activator NlpD